MQFDDKDGVVKKCIEEKFLSEKLMVTDKMSNWFIKIIISFSALRVFTGLFYGDFWNVQVFVSGMLLLVFIPVYYYTKNKPGIKYYVSFLLLWGIEPVSMYYSFWVYPKYDILYGMGNTILLYYGILEMAYTFHSGVVYICIHSVAWCLAGYYSSHIPFPEDIDTCFSILSTFLFHILFFKNRFDSEIEGVKNKCIIDKKQDLISTIVQAIPEGILVIDYNCGYLLKNASFDVLVNGNLDLPYIPLLKNYAETKSTMLSEDIKEFCLSHQLKIVFGTVKSCGFMLEVTGTKVKWELTPAIILTFRDVTGLIKLEKEVVENSSILQVLRGVSHELKTPLNVIINKLQISLDQVEELTKNELKVALNASKYLLFSIRDIIDYSALKFQKYFESHSRVNLNHIIHKCVCIACSYYGVEASCVRVQIDKMIDEVVIDKARFKQIAVSLLTKALNVSCDKVVDLSLALDEELMNVVISFDCKEEKVGEVDECEEFSYTGSKIRVGSGFIHDLTKAIIKETTKKDLKVGFKPPSKFSFSFFIPIYNENTITQEEEIPEEGKRMYPRPPLSKDSLDKILVVDDIPINLQIAKSLLNGIKVDCVGILSGKEAIDLLLSQNESLEKFKVIIMDCMMPEMDGWETTSCIHSLFSEEKLGFLPYIIGHSAFEQQKDIEKCFESGMDDFLPKPSPSSEFYNKISKWMAEPMRYKD